MKRIKLIRNIPIFLIILIVFSVFNTDQFVYANFEGFFPKCRPGEIDSENNSGDTDAGTNTSSGKAGAWTEEGTKANSIAQEIWDYWKGKGFGGAAISGVMGNVAHEGGFDIPDRAEGHYGGDSKTDGISEGNIPATMSHYPVGNTGGREGGAGHYQFTPYSKFAPAGDSKWKSTKSQNDFVWTSEVQKATWLNEYINLSSVEKAVEMWFVKYERGMSLNPAKIDSGKKAYEVFGGSNISADSALANAVDTANQGEEEAKERSSNLNICAPNDGLDSSGATLSGDSGEIVSIANSLLGYFKYVMIHGESYIGSVDKPDKGGVTDCSGFVWLVLAKGGYKNPPNMGWYTGSMEDDALGEQKYLKKISAEEAKAGDIVIVTASGKTGHTAILLEDWKDAKPSENTTEIIQMGGISMDGVNSDAFNSSFRSLVNGNHTITFARAIKE